MSLARPTMLVNPDVARRNIQRMADKFSALGIRLRPHFKTHQSLEVGRWFRRAGMDAITVSSLEMAARFLQDGWRDILIAIPFNPAETEVINGWPAALRLHLLVDHPATVERIARRLTRSVDMWIKIDSGYHRCGIPAEALDEVRSLAAAIRAQPRMRLAGLLTHAGQTYSAADPDGVRQLHRQSLDLMNTLRRRLAQAGEGEWVISIGDTPACSLAGDFPGVREVRCGNFVYYDVMQHRLGSCRLDDIAVRMICPVIGSYPRRREVAVHCGKVHLSAESLTGDDGRPFFGLVAAYSAADPWPAPIPGAWVRSLSQEHGIIRMPENRAGDFLPGDHLAVLPIHSCLAADLTEDMIDLQGRRIAGRSSPPHP